MARGNAEDAPARSERGDRLALDLAWYLASLSWVAISRTPLPAYSSWLSSGKVGQHRLHILLMPFRCEVRQIPLAAFVTHRLAQSLIIEDHFEAISQSYCVSCLDQQTGLPCIYNLGNTAPLGGHHG